MTKNRLLLFEPKLNFSDLVFSYLQQNINEHTLIVFPSYSALNKYSQLILRELDIIENVRLSTINHLPREIFSPFYITDVKKKISVEYILKYLFKTDPELRSILEEFNISDYLLKEIKEFILNDELYCLEDYKEIIYLIKKKYNDFVLSENIIDDIRFTKNCIEKVISNKESSYFFQNIEKIIFAGVLTYNSEQREIISFLVKEKVFIEVIYPLLPDKTDYRENITNTLYEELSFFQELKFAINDSIFANSQLSDKIYDNLYTMNFESAEKENEIEFLKCRGEIGEVNSVINRIALLYSQGVDLSKILITSDNIGKYIFRLRNKLSENNISVYTTKGIPLTIHPLISYLLLPLKIFFDDYMLSTIINYIDSPYSEFSNLGITKNEIKQFMQLIYDETDGYQMWSSFLSVLKSDEKLLLKLNSYNLTFEETDLLKSISRFCQKGFKKQEGIIHFLENIRKFFKLLESILTEINSFKQCKTNSDFFDTYISILQKYFNIRFKNNDKIRIDSEMESALITFSDFLQEYWQKSNRISYKTDFSEFYREMNNNMKSLSYRFVESKVSESSVTAADYSDAFLLQYDYVFVLGLNDTKKEDEIFLKRKSEERRNINLTHFMMILANRSKKIFLFYPAYSNENIEQFPSYKWESLLNIIKDSENYIIDDTKEFSSYQDSSKILFKKSAVLNSLIKFSQMQKDKISNIRISSDSSLENKINFWIKNFDYNIYKMKSINMIPFRKNYASDKNIYPLRKDKKGRSISYIERYFRCPRNFYFANVLSLASNEFSIKEDFEALDLGLLLHSILEKYELAVMTNDLTLTEKEEIIKDCYQDYKNLITGDNDYLKSVFHLIESNILVILNNFIQFDETFIRMNGYKPKYLEKSFNFKYNEGLSFSLEDEILYLNGRIDRIDFLEPDQYNLYDYKKSFNNTKITDFNELQFYFYVKLIQQRFRTSNLPNFYYIALEKLLNMQSLPLEDVLFNSLEIVEKKMDLIEYEKEVKKHLSLLLSGFFPVSDQKESFYSSPCRFCDFRSLCLTEEY